MINLTLTKNEASLLRAALYVAEVNAWDNVNDTEGGAFVAHTLTHLRREIEYRQQLAKESEGVNNG